MCTGLEVRPGFKTTQREQTKIRVMKETCSKLSAVVATANFQQKKQNKKFVDF